eukprot:gene1275-1780_t
MSATAPLLTTPLNALHIELGARMVPFAGYSMPVQYPAGLMAEHVHTRTAAGLFDVSHMGQLKLVGADAAAAFETLVPVDVIDASTEAAARSASRSLEGAFSREIAVLREALIQLRMLVEATLDFPEEEIDFLKKADAQGQLKALQSQLGAVLKPARQGRLLREGITVVIAGQPNAGKSSLLNALAGAELAIVTPIAGTTRDK